LQNGGRQNSKDNGIGSLSGKTGKDDHGGSGWTTSWTRTTQIWSHSAEKPRTVRSGGGEFIRQSTPSGRAPMEREEICWMAETANHHFRIKMSLMNIHTGRPVGSSYSLVLVKK
jgi:hypothetical protein